MIAQVILSGLLIGGIYALVAIGLNLVFGVLRIINFAHCGYLVCNVCRLLAVRLALIPMSRHRW